MKINGSVALVTGANRGIGRALVEALKTAGAARIYATARKLESLGEIVDDGDGRVLPIALDVTDGAQVRAAAEKAGDVTLLINNAGILFHGGVIAADGLDGARREMETNYLGMLAMARAFAPVLAANGGGALLNVLSVAALVNFPLAASYSASKAAAHSLTQALRVELAAQGTHVVGLYPGPVDTDMAAEIDMEKVPPSRIAEAALAALESGDEDVFPDPMAEEIAAAYAASPKALEKYIAGMANDAGTGS